MTKTRLPAHRSRNAFSTLDGVGPRLSARFLWGLGSYALLLAAPCVGACQTSEAAKIPPAPVATGSAPALVGIYGLHVKRLDGTEVALSAWAGKVLLIVNTASQCGYTPQYEGLEALHAAYEARGFAVLGFPSNDFGGQEPGSSEQIATFCKTKFGVTFPMFEKVKVTGNDAAPLYKLLTEAKGEPKWNFHKYLIDKHGRPTDAWPSAVTPSSPEIARAIERELARD